VTVTTQIRRPVLDSVVWGWMQRQDSIHWEDETKIQIAIAWASDDESAVFTLVGVVDVPYCNFLVIDQGLNIW